MALVLLATDLDLLGVLAAVLSVLDLIGPGGRDGPGGAGIGILPARRLASVVVLARADMNGDGQIDRREFHLRLVEVFYHADTDKSGFLTPEQLNRATVFEEDFSEADKDGDGRISLYEFIDYRFDDFDEVDTDSNGLLSVGEVTAAFEN